MVYRPVSPGYLQVSHPSPVAPQGLPGATLGVYTSPQVNLFAVMVKDVVMLFKVTCSVYYTIKLDKVFCNLQRDFEIEF